MHGYLLSEKLAERASLTRDTIRYYEVVETLVILIFTLVYTVVSVREALAPPAALRGAYRDALG